MIIGSSFLSTNKVENVEKTFSYRKTIAVITYLIDKAVKSKLMAGYSICRMIPFSLRPSYTKTTLNVVENLNDNDGLCTGRIRTGCIGYRLQRVPINICITGYYHRLRQQGYENMIDTVYQLPARDCDCELSSILIHQGFDIRSTTRSLSLDFKAFMSHEEITDLLCIALKSIFGFLNLNG